MIIDHVYKRRRRLVLYNLLQYTFFILFDTISSLFVWNHSENLAIFPCSLPYLPSTLNNFVSKVSLNNPGHILELYLSIQVRFVTSKMELLIYNRKNTAYVLPNELPNELKRDLRKLGNARKTSNSLPLFHKKNFDESSKKICKSKHHSFLVLFNLAQFLYFVPNILSICLGL